eukprot:8294435-Heterocapsa_arctica.AAC.1
MAQRWLGPLVVVKSDQPTCRTTEQGSCLDYSEVRPISEFVIKPKVDLICEALTYPHWPVVMHLQVAGVEEKVKVWKKAKPCQPKPVVGPRLDHGHEWEDLVKVTREALQRRGGKTFIQQKKEDQQQLGALWKEWNDKAANEARGLFGHEGPMGQPFTVSEAKVSSLLPTADSDRLTPSRAFAWVRRRSSEFAAWVGTDKDKALGAARQMTGATDGMLTKQMGRGVAGDLAEIAAATWADFFGDEEGKAQAYEWKEKEKDWDVFIRASLEKGAGIADKLATKVYVQRMTLVQGPDGELSSTPQAELQQQVSQWNKLWDCTGQQRRELIDWEEEDLLPVPRPNELREAAASFSIGTSAIDGWRPRNFAALSDGALELMGLLM